MPVEVPELVERCVVINGVAKTYAMTGWRVGWMIAPQPLIKAAASLQSHTNSNVANVAQAAALAAVEGGLEAAFEMRESFDRRRQTMHKMLNEIEGVVSYEPQGAFYCFPNFNAILGRTIAGRRIETDLDLAAVVLEEAKVAFVPGEGFGGPGYGRLSYATSDDDIVEGVGRIADLLS
jgi:aspartate/methionine/tyrosine aminotransferase